MNISNSRKYALPALLVLFGTACGGGDQPAPMSDAGGLDARRDTQIDDDVQVQGDVGALDGDLVGAPGACPDDSASVDTVGTRVFSGSTLRRGNDYNPTCGSEGGADVVHRWRAPRNGRFIVDTVGSSFDTLLELRRGTTCPGQDAGAAGAQCDDDGGGSATTSAVTVTVTAGEEFLLVVDGFSAAEAGNYFVNITDVTYDGTTFQLPAFQATRDSIATRTCEACFAAAMYASRDECLRDLAIGPRGSGCETSSYASSTELNDALACRHLANTAVNTCLTGLQACDTAAYEGCLADGDRIERTCPAIPTAFATAQGLCARGCPSNSGTGTTITGTLPTALNNDNNQVAVCGAGAGQEVYVQWTPPSVGNWLVTTEGSAYDATLASLANCAATTGTCGTNNISSTNNSARILLDVRDTNPITLVVDGALATAAGAYQLNFAQFLCPGPNPLTSAVTVNGTIAPGQSLFNTCNAGEGPESVVRWTPPVNGKYLVTTTGSAINASVEVASECRNFGGGICARTGASPARLFVDATTAQNYLFLVDSPSSAGGAYQLNFTTNFACSDFAAPLTTSSVSADTTDGVDVLRLSCGAQRIRTREVSYLWTAPTAGTFRFSTFGSAIDTVLGIFRAPAGNSCAEPTQVACNDNYELSGGIGRDSGVDAGGGDGGIRAANSAIDLVAEAGVTYIVSVEGFPVEGFDQNFDIVEVAETAGSFNLMVTQR